MEREAGVVRGRVDLQRAQYRLMRLGMQRGTYGTRVVSAAPCGGIGEQAECGVAGGKKTGDAPVIAQLAGHLRLEIQVVLIGQTVKVGRRRHVSVCQAKADFRQFALGKVTTHHRAA